MPNGIAFVAGPFLLFVFRILAISSSMTNLTTTVTCKSWLSIRLVWCATPIGSLCMVRVSILTGTPIVSIMFTTVIAVGRTFTT